MADTWLLHGVEVDDMKSLLSTMSLGAVWTRNDTSDNDEHRTIGHIFYMIKKKNEQISRLHGPMWIFKYFN